MFVSYVQEKARDADNPLLIEQLVYITEKHIVAWKTKPGHITRGPRDLSAAARRTAGQKNSWENPKMGLSGVEQNVGYLEIKRNLVYLERLPA